MFFLGFCDTMKIILRGSPQSMCAQRKASYFLCDWAVRPQHTTFTREESFCNNGFVPNRSGYTLFSPIAFPFEAKQCANW